MGGLGQGGELGVSSYGHLDVPVNPHENRNNNNTTSVSSSSKSGSRGTNSTYSQKEIDGGCDTHGDFTVLGSYVRQNGFRDNPNNGPHDNGHNTYDYTLNFKNRNTPHSKELQVRNPKSKSSPVKYYHTIIKNPLYFPISIYCSIGMSCNVKYCIRQTAQVFFYHTL